MKPESPKSAANETLHVIERVRIVDEEEVIDYYLIRDGHEINLSKVLKKQIQDTPEIFENDLAFICIGDEYEVEHFGLYSFTRKSIIFPFIIAEYSQLTNGFFHLDLLEGWEKNEEVHDDCPEMLVGSNIAYLNRDGSFFQNLGEVMERLDETHYILERSNNWSPATYMLFDAGAEPEVRILLDGLTELPTYISEYFLLVYKDKNGVGIFDLKKKKTLFYLKGVRHLSVLNRSFFQVSHLTVEDIPFVFFRRILNSKGEVLLEYSIHEKTKTRHQSEEDWMESSIELYFQNDFHKALLKDLNIDHGIITLSAFNVIKGEEVVLRWHSSDNSEA